MKGEEYFCRHIHTSSFNQRVFNESKITNEVICGCFTSDLFQIKILFSWYSVNPPLKSSLQTIFDTTFLRKWRRCTSNWSVPFSLAMNFFIFNFILIIKMLALLIQTADYLFFSFTKIFWDDWLETEMFGSETNCILLLGNVFIHKIIFSILYIILLCHILFIYSMNFCTGKRKCSKI